MRAAESCTKRKGFSSSACFYLTSFFGVTCGLVVSPPIAPSPDFPLVAASLVSWPSAFRAVLGGSKWRRAAGERGGKKWVPSGLWSIYLLVDPDPRLNLLRTITPPFSLELLLNGDTRRKTGFGNRWLGGRKIKDGLAASGSAVRWFTFLLAPCTRDLWSAAGFLRGVPERTWVPVKVLMSEHSLDKWLGLGCVPRLGEEWILIK